jgi:hypothetical protein
MARTSPIRLRTVAATIVVVASGLIIFNVYQSIINSADETPQALPIIQADSTPFRVLPEDPGGAKIPGQGSTLFNVIDNDQSDPLALDGADLSPEPTTIDNVQEGAAEPQGFELPEAPEPRTESLYGMIEDLKERDTQPEGVVETKKEMAAVSSDVVEPLADETRAELQEKLTEVIVRAETVAKDDAAVKKVMEDKGMQAAAVIPTPQNKPSVPPQAIVIETGQVVERAVQAGAPKQYYIQLASLRDEAAARSAYERIRDNFPNLVSGLNVVFPKADLGSRGTFTRIQVGPLTEAQAKKRCADYTSAARGGTCLVINR